jgi:DNA repair exonuclease SbcCD ATPase subunit
MPARMEDVDTNTANLLVGMASMEARQAALAVQMLEANAREDERLKALTERLQERHKALVENLDERHEGVKEAQEAILEKLDSIIETLRPMEKRIEELEHAKSKATGVAAAVGGGTIALSGIVSWLTDLLKP